MPEEISHVRRFRAECLEKALETLMLPRDLMIQEFGDRREDLDGTENG